MANYCSHCGASLGRNRETESDREKSSAAPKKKRGPSAYNKRYSAAFKRISKKNKTKKGSWKKGGYARTVRAAHKAAKKR